MDILPQTSFRTRRWAGNRAGGRLRRPDPRRCEFAVGRGTTTACAPAGAIVIVKRAVRIHPAPGRRPVVLNAFLALEDAAAARPVSGRPWHAAQYVVGR